VPTLCEFVRIPNKSPLFDAQWEAHGHMEKGREFTGGLVPASAHQGDDGGDLTAAGPHPAPADRDSGQTDDTVLMYGHLDKQPEFHRLGSRDWGRGSR